MEQHAEVEGFTSQVIHLMDPPNHHIFRPCLSSYPGLFGLIESVQLGYVYIFGHILLLSPFLLRDVYTTHLVERV